MNRSDMDDPLVDTITAANFLGFEPNTLRVWKSTKRHDLKPVVIGRSVRYKMSDLRQFRDERQRH